MFHQKCRTLHFSLLNLIQFISDNFPVYQGHSKSFSYHPVCLHSTSFGVICKSAKFALSPICQIPNAIIKQLPNCPSRLMGVGMEPPGSHCLQGMEGGHRWCPVSCWVWGCSPLSLSLPLCPTPTWGPGSLPLLLPPLRSREGPPPHPAPSLP